MNVRQALFGDSKCLALAANAVATCTHNRLGGQSTPHKQEEAHKNEDDTTKQRQTVIKSLDDFKKTWTRQDTDKPQHTKCIYSSKYTMANI